MGGHERDVEFRTRSLPHAPSHHPPAFFWVLHSLHRGSRATSRVIHTLEDPGDSMLDLAQMRETIHLVQLCDGGEAFRDKA